MAKSEQKQVEQPTEAAPAAKLLDVNELALKHGHTFHKLAKDGVMRPTVWAHDSVFKQEHLQADVLHGWTKHAFHTSEAVLMSDEDYLAAIEAAKTGKTHAPANKRTAAEAAQRQAQRDAAKKGA